MQRIDNRAIVFGMRLITLPLFAVVLAVSAFGQEPGENAVNELSWKDWIDLLDKVGRWAFLLGPLLWPLDRWVHKCKWGWLKKLEFLETHRVAGGLLGGGVGGMFLLAELEAGPIVCGALFGGVFGTSRLRVPGMVIGAGIGLVVSCRLLSPVEVPQWWFATALIPLGGLLAGAMKRP